MAIEVPENINRADEILENDSNIEQSVKSTRPKSPDDTFAMTRKSGSRRDNQEEINKLRESLEDGTPEGRMQELNERADWLQDFASRIENDPEAVTNEEIQLLISYIEKFKYSANDENKEKIDTLVRELRSFPPETREGSYLYKEAAERFSSQYRILSKRENLKAQGISREERVRRTTPPTPIPRKEVSQPTEEIKVAPPQSKSWLGRIKSWFGK